jgi:retinal rod rhodopsin-sensitive cGMP 3',5'-cyclic phosphodiesterase subunit delta
MEYKHAEQKDIDEDNDERIQLERDWKSAAAFDNVGALEVSDLDVAAGFRINFMNMRNATTGELVWESGSWDQRMFREELVANVPASILNCRAVSREINFSSSEEIEHFRIEQRVFFEGTCIEEWRFDFGFVIPGSTNSWQQVIRAADQMLEPDALSGNVTIETSFFDGNGFIGKSLVRIFYT